jgi:predicted nucleotidyltransferase
MPKIKDVKKHLAETIEEIKKSEDINSLYVWGSYARNQDKPNFRIRDIDVIAMTDFDSGDLAAIDNEILTQKLSQEELEDQGYNPTAIKFSSDFLSFKKQNIDHWAISSDKKLLHWGPIPSSKEESDELNKEASNHAFNQTGCCRDKIHRAKQEVRDNWYEEHHSYLSKAFTNMPSGWYLSDTEDIQEVLDSSIKF